jgi:hypothetical protein
MSQVPTFTDEQVMTTLRQVVNERPEYVYTAPKHMRDFEGDPSCFYVHTDVNGGASEPGCVVGAVLNRLGVPLESLAEWEGASAHAVAMRVCYMPPRTAAALSRAQDAQDNGTTWERALASAELVPVGIAL